MQAVLWYEGPQPGLGSEVMPQILAVINRAVARPQAFLQVRVAGELPALLPHVLVNNTSLHHKHHASHSRDIGQRIAIQGDNVSLHPRRN